MTAALRVRRRSCAALVCPFCRDVVDATDAVHACARCHARVHADCWGEHPACPCCRATQFAVVAPAAPCLPVVAASPRSQCAARTRRGARCAPVNSHGEFCWQHASARRVVRHASARGALAPVSLQRPRARRWPPPRPPQPRPPRLPAPRPGPPRRQTSAAAEPVTPRAGRSTARPPYVRTSPAGSCGYALVLGLVAFALLPASPLLWICVGAVALALWEAGSAQ